jgi:hypothetical protein
MAAPGISVVIPACNPAPLAARAVRSVLAVIRRGHYVCTSTRIVLRERAGNALRFSDLLERHRSV